MDLKITITKKNKEKVFQIIAALLEEEANGTIEIGNNKKQIQSLIPSEIENSEKDYLKIPNLQNNLEHAKPNFYINDDRPQRVGTWGQVNSFFSIKAALRVLANYLEKKDVDSINLNIFVEICIKLFKENGLNIYRGFPSTEKDTAIGRFVWHFLTAAHEMGLIIIKESMLDYDGMPSSLHDLEDVKIGITQEGLEFARLKNNILDGISNKQVLTQEEKYWMVSFLKKIDSEGYKEYSLLKDVFEFIKQGNNGKNDLCNWFENDQRFIEFIKSWSRKAESGKAEELKNQIKNLATTYSAAKVAFLRELGIIRNKRNNYDIIGELE